MKHLFNFGLIIILTLLAFLSPAQTTNFPYVRSTNNRGVIQKVELTNDETIVTIRFKSRDYQSIAISSATIIVPEGYYDINDARRSRLAYPNFTPTPELAQMYRDAIRRINEGRKAMKEAGYLIKSLGRDELDQYYKTNGKDRDYYYFELHFNRIPVGLEEIYIREVQENGFEWVGIKINNPFPKTPNTGYTEYTIKQKIDEQNDGIVGIYEETVGNKYKLGCIKDNGTYKIIYLGSNESLKQWKIGDLKATLRPTATPGFFKADWYLRDKTLDPEWYISFNGSTMKCMWSAGNDDLYIKMYPSANSSGSGALTGTVSSWSGSGFALNNGYIVTNYHVVDGANSITVKGIKGNFETAYKAIVVATDKHNDLALIKINDNRFNGFGPIPYMVKTSTAEVGEDVFVLGYPLTTTMGDEIKYTTGVISSKTGFQGDVSVYQISAPIQPGNSGGPLFNSKGSLIGIVNAKHKGAENVGYAIKASYLRSLVESCTSSSIIPSTNSISTSSRTEQIKAIKKCVFLIECTE